MILELMWASFVVTSIYLVFLGIDLLVGDSIILNNGILKILSIKV